MDGSPRHGPELIEGGGVRFRLWAPACDAVALALEEGREVPMQRAEDGWFAAEVAAAGAGTLYRFRLPDGTLVPDPGSRFQPRDVHGPSEVVDHHAYPWGDGGWTGRSWREAVVYELHVGAFTPEGTFRAAIGRLDHLVWLGVTAIELMPVADFPGSRNWGYDGVLPFAPDSSYGRPEDFKALVEAAHARGLMVLLDVVYNHFGPDGNYMPLYAPAVFTERHKTPWGAAVNFDGEEAGPVRGLAVQSAVAWIRDYHLDGLRLDAVHAILDDAPVHILRELAEAVRAAADGRAVHLMLENEENQARWLARRGDGAEGLYSAQWNDDVHHVLHVAITGEDAGYYADYLGDTEKLGRALAEGFAFQGEPMAYRGSPRGEPSWHLPPEAFVAFLQNHDQIGNRAFGDRIGMLAAPAAVKAAAATYLLLPQVPMLFMGEEWGTLRPFPFFCGFEGELAEAVRKGRREEFARFPQFQDPEARARIPDPQAEATFLSAKLDWDEPAHEPHAGWLDWHRRVLAVRRQEIVPRIRLIWQAGEYELVAEGAVLVRWALAGGAALVLEANLSDAPVSGFPAPEAGDAAIWLEGEVHENGTFEPWTVRWSVRR